MRHLVFLLACGASHARAPSPTRKSNHRRALASVLVAESPLDAFSYARLVPQSRKPSANILQTRRGDRASTFVMRSDHFDQDIFAGGMDRRAAVKSTIAAALGSVLSMGSVDPANAIGADSMTIFFKVNSYKEIECPVSLASGRAGGALGDGAGGGGIAQKCVEVQVEYDNQTGKDVESAAVFGQIKDDYGMSVLGNGQDDKNDAGQLAIIDKIPKGKTQGSFVFVAQQSDDCKMTKKMKMGIDKFCPVNGTAPLAPINFASMKAIAYPGGSRYKEYDECEQNPFAAGCP